MNLEFDTKQVIILVALMALGIVTATGYLTYRYSTTSRSADYSKEERFATNQAMAAVVEDNTDAWEDETLVCIVDSAYRGLFESETDYTVAIYTLDEEAFAAGQAADASYSMNTLWGYSKSGPKKDKYQSLVKVGSAQIVRDEKTGKILSCQITEE